MAATKTKELFTVTEIELIYRNKVPPSLRPSVHSSREAYYTLMQVWDMNKIEIVEQFYILLLNKANRCLGVANISTGGVTGCVADPKIILGMALKGGATGLILAHNHPSGNLMPSQGDIIVTRKISEGGTAIGISVHDHLIVTPERYYSFADEGLVL